MTDVEIRKELSLSYYDLCSYLISKYGPAQYDYFATETCASKNRKVTRTAEGLTCHHMDEDKGGNLSNSPQAKIQPFEWQKKERLVYCNSLEHLILHMKIAVIRQKGFFSQPIDIDAFFTTGGIYMICQEINDLFLMPEQKMLSKQRCLEIIKDNYDDYIQIVRCFIRYIEKNYVGEKSNDSVLKSGAVYKTKDDSYIVLDFDQTGEKVKMVNTVNGEERTFHAMFLYKTYNDFLDKVIVGMSRGYECAYRKIYSALIADDSAFDKKYDEALFVIDYSPSN